jgi:hypothetical protein
MKPIINPILTAIISAIIIGLCGFVLSTKQSEAIFSERFSNSTRYFELILVRLDKIEQKLDNHLQRR